MTKNNLQTPPPLPSGNKLEGRSFSFTPSLERSLFIKVFAWMGGALFVTAMSALLFASSSLAFRLIHSPALFLGLIIAEIVVVVLMSASLRRISFAAAAILMVIYSILNGATLSIVFIAFSLGQVARVFFITAGMFAGMAVIGATTKRNLTPVLHFLMMALVGLLLMLVVNMFLRSTTMDWIISVIGVVLFTVLTAVDTNRIKHFIGELASGGADDETLNKVSLFGSFMLYLDFINLFIYLLRFFGNRN